jgi:hypothetical protein
VPVLSIQETLSVCIQEIKVHIVCLNEMTVVIVEQSASNRYTIGGLCPLVCLSVHVFHIHLSLELQHNSIMVHFSVEISTLWGVSVRLCCFSKVDPIDILHAR